MKMFLFRLSRLISILIFILVIGITIGFLDDFSRGDYFDLLGIPTFGIPLLCLILIFNWLCFGKPTLWIKNPNTEHE